MDPRQPGAAGLSLAQNAAARLCHDLSGPIGGLLAAIELAGEDAAMAPEALAAAGEAATALARRLRLLRAAWGPAGGPMSGVDMRTLLQGLAPARRVELRLEGFGESDRFAAPFARLVLNAVMVAVESLGGEGVASAAQAPGMGVLVTIAGPRAAWPVGLAGWLADAKAAAEGAAAAGPRALQAPLTALLAHAGGMSCGFLLPAGASTQPALLLRDA